MFIKFGGKRIHDLKRYSKITIGYVFQMIFDKNIDVENIDT